MFGGESKLCGGEVDWRCFNGGYALVERHGCLRLGRSGEGRLGGGHRSFETTALEIFWRMMVAAYVRHG